MSARKPKGKPRKRNARRPPSQRGESAVAKAKAVAEKVASRAKATAKGLRRRVAELEEKLAKRRRERNPRRPPRGWWDDCIAKVEARHGKVRDARAVCGADWWGMSDSQRRAVVERLERAGDYRAAIALARAERSRRRRGRGRRGNPAPRGNPKELVELVYRERKPEDDREYDYQHKFSGRLPKLAEERGRLVLRGGSYKMRDGWIHG